METYKLDTSVGNHFKEVASEAKKMSHEMSMVVEFDFNGIICLVSETTPVELLFRDYLNSHKMNWKTIGPDCEKEYDLKTLKKLKRMDQLEKERREKQRKEWEAKDKAERIDFENKTYGVELKLSDKDKWEKSRKINSDGYGKAALDYAEGWAKLMQIEIDKGKTIEECYEHTKDGLGFLGITGFQFGCAVGVLSETWKYGEELRKVHNKKYGISENRKGVANPALWTIDEQ